MPISKGMITHIQGKLRLEFRFLRLAGHLPRAVYSKLASPKQSGAQKILQQQKGLTNYDGNSSSVR